MTVLQRLIQALDSCDNDNESILLKQWIEDLQGLFSSSPSDSKDILSQTDLRRIATDQIPDLLNEAATKLRQRLLATLFDKEKIQGISSETRDLNSDFDLSLELQKVNIYELIQSKSSQTLQLLKELLQSSAFFLRWYWQYASLSMSNQYDAWELALEPLQTRSMLRLYFNLHLHYKYSGNHQNETVNDDLLVELARCASQLFFYSAYSLTLQRSFTKDSVKKDLQKFLVQDLQCHQHWLKALVQAPTMSLSLSILRNIHHVLASFSSSKDQFLQVDLQSRDLGHTSTSLWSIIVNNDDHPITYYNTLVFVAKQTVNQLFNKQQQSDDSINQNTTINIQCEFLTEIFRCLYALQLGSRLQMPPSLQQQQEQQQQRDDQAFSQLVKDVLSLNKNITISNSIIDDNDDKNSSKSSSLIKECQLALLPVLMDASISWVPCIEPQTPTLVELLDDQVTLVLQQQSNDANASAATLVPILVVLYRFCGNENFRMQVKNRVFPPQAEATFQALVKKEQSQNAKAKNMTPLDAPKNTLRYKIIQLLTWPESHIKRFAGELLWVLCDNDPQEFTYRVGLGNGLPILAAKGFAQIPNFS